MIADNTDTAQLTAALDAERQRNQALSDENARLRAEVKYQAAQISAFHAARAAMQADFDFLLRLYNCAVGIAS